MKESFEVSAKLIPAIIGERGSVIKHLRKVSGTKIIVSNFQSDTPDSTRQVLIEGPAEAVAKCRYTLEKILSFKAQQNPKNNSQDGRP